MKKSILVAIFSLFFISSALYAQFMQAGLSERLYSKLKLSNPDDKIKIMIVLKEQVDIAALDKHLYDINASAEYRAKTVITSLMDKAASTQGPVLTFLAEQNIAGKVTAYKPFWVTNFIWAEVKPEIVYSLAGRYDVAEMDIDAELDYDRPVAVEPAGEKDASSEVGLRVINAHKMWEIGITGAGRLVMNDDKVLTATTLLLIINGEVQHHHGIMHGWTRLQARSSQATVITTGLIQWEL